MDKKWSVYAHINKANGDVYIGITSQKLSERFRNGNGYKKSIYFWRAIEKYGWDGFKHIVVARDLSEGSAKEIERIVISSLKDQSIRLYNLTAGGEGMAGSHMSEEAIEKIRNALRGRPKTESHKQKLSESRKGRFTGKDNPNYGHHLTDEAKRRIGDARRGSKNSNFGKAGQQTTASKYVAQYSLDGKLIAKYPSLSEASRVSGIGLSGISKCCRGSFSQSHGYIWKFANNKEAEGNE